MSKSQESKTYAKLGASSSKKGVLQALGTKPNSSKFFVDLNPDTCDNSDYYSLIHSDGAGTKSIIAYLAYRETGDPSWFRGIAQDSLIMNLDDVVCVGAFESLFFSNTIGRNRRLVPDEAIEELVNGYRDCVEMLQQQGINIAMGGGETADLGDLVRTIVVDSTLFARVKKKEAVATTSMKPAHIIVGLSNTGKASYENHPNSSIASNGLTLARHALISKEYLEKYPEIVDPGLNSTDCYRGQGDLLKPRDELGCSLAQALLSPTRTYAPIVKQILENCDRSKIHGIINCTGGGQTKLLRFGEKIQFVKDNLFPCPPLFKLIQNSLSLAWEEMYAVFNMGHRLEIICEEDLFGSIDDISSEFSVEARKIGYLKDSADHNKLIIKSEFGEFVY